MSRDPNGYHITRIKLGPGWYKYRCVGGGFYGEAPTAYHAWLDCLKARSPGYWDRVVAYWAMRAVESVSTP